MTVMRAPSSVERAAFVFVPFTSQAKIISVQPVWSDAHTPW